MAHRIPFSLTPVILATHAVLAAVAPVGASAQTLAETVVSASRSEQRSFDAPAAIQRVDQAQIQAAGPQVNLSESLVRVPGLTMLDRSNYAQDLQVSMRGFGARAAFGIRGIRLLIDGIPATTPDGQGQGSTISLPSTDRIEVLRGPAALLYGNSSGGVIQAFTRPATDTPQAQVQLHTGSWGMQRTDTQWSDTVGGVGIVADYSTFHVGGYRDNSEADRRQFNSRISFALGEQTRADLVLNRFDMPYALDPLGLTAAQLAANPTQAGTGAQANFTRKSVLQSQAGGRVVHTLDADRSITARAYYGNRDNLQFQTNAQWTGLARDYYGTGVQYNARSTLGEHTLEWAAGYEFDRSREYRQAGASRGGLKASTTRREDNQAENSDWFVQGASLLSEHWSLSAGLRSSTVRFVSDDYVINATDADGSGSTAYSAVVPMLGLTWHASDQLNLYANTGGGFETPTLAEMAYSGTATVTPVFNPSLKASTSEHLELGLKWVPDAASRVDLALYQITTRDEIVVNRNASGRSSYKNAPATQRRGLELSASTRLGSQWSALVAASAIEATYTQGFSTASGTTTTVVASGNKLPGIPATSLFAELAWSSAVVPARKGAPAMGPRVALELVHAGAMAANDTNTAQADGHTVFNLSASQRWSLGRAVLALHGRLNNLADERYASSVIVNQAAAQFYEPGLPRNWSLGLNLTLPL